MIKEWSDCGTSTFKETMTFSTKSLTYSVQKWNKMSASRFCFNRRQKGGTKRTGKVKQ